MEKRIKNFEFKLKNPEKKNKGNKDILKTENLEDKIIEEEEKESKLSSPKSHKSGESIESKDSKYLKKSENLSEKD